MCLRDSDPLPQRGLVLLQIKVNSKNKNKNKKWGRTDSPNFRFSPNFYTRMLEVGVVLLLDGSGIELAVW